MADTQKLQLTWLKVTHRELCKTGTQSKDAQPCPEHHSRDIINPLLPLSLGLQGEPTSPSSGRPVLNIHWKDWHWSWNSNTLATWCERLTHMKRLWCWEGLRAGGEGDTRGWDGWMASPTQWRWVWVISGSWWWTGRPGVLQSMGSHRVGHNWATERHIFKLRKWLSERLFIVVKYSKFNYYKLLHFIYT